MARLVRPREKNSAVYTTVPFKAGIISLGTWGAGGSLTLPQRRFRDWHRLEFKNSQIVKSPSDRTRGVAFIIIIINNNNNNVCPLYCW